MAILLLLRRRRWWRRWRQIAEMEIDAGPVFWQRDFFVKQEQLGEFHTVVKEMRKEIGGVFFRYKFMFINIYLATVKRLNGVIKNLVRRFI